MKTYRLLLLIILFAVISACAGYILYFKFAPEQITTINMTVRIGNKVGLNADTDALHFGTLGPGSEGERSIILTNHKDYPVKVKISTSGFISNWVRVSENNFIIDPNISKNITFTAKAPDLEFGKYDGTATITFSKIII